MEHVLDNPGWNALISGNKHLANGTDNVKYFSAEVSIFTGLRNRTAAELVELHGLLPYDGPIGFVSDVKREIPGVWNVLQCIHCYQMLHDQAVKPVDPAIDFVPLSDEHIPQMLALTKLTNPGPFSQRTIDFGHYYGIFDDDKLVAMAGQRMHIFEYAEISAVCTHPDHLGRGYAGQLLLHHIHRIKATGGVPMLHVRNTNERAIKVYERMGFTTRKELYFYILKK